MIDAYGGGEQSKRFILHYNFPPFSVGETGRTGGPGRREIGHGALAERSLEPVVPSENEFRYAIRISSEIMESNGSTSMASVCGGMLALMDAGVPVKGMVAGISIGLVSEAGDDGQLKRYELLTDIIGSEDHYGDMDFKLCGTDAGVTGFQLDLKLPGIGHNIMAEAIQRAKETRTKILEIMRSTLDQPRTELSKYAPRIETIKINPEKIGALIGPGGKTIKGIVAETGAEINIEDDGSVHIYATTGESMARAKEIIGGMTREIENRTNLSGTRRHDEGVRGVCRSFPRQRRLGAHFRACRFSSEPHRGRGQDWRHDLGQMHRHRRQRPRKTFAQGGAERTR